MKILLVEPSKAPSSLGGEDIFLYEPLALEYIAAGVSKDHDVMIFDQRLEKNLQDVLESFRPHIVGKTISRITTQNNYDKVLATHATQQFNKLVAGQVIKDVSRRGKFIVFNLNHGHFLIHLR